MRFLLFPGIKSESNHQGINASCYIDAGPLCPNFVSAQVDKAAYFYTSWAEKNVFNRPTTNQIKLQSKFNCQKTKIRLLLSVFSVSYNFSQIILFSSAEIQLGTHNEPSLFFSWSKNWEPWNVISNFWFIRTNIYHHWN